MSPENNVPKKEMSLKISIKDAHFFQFRKYIFVLVKNFKCDIN